MAREKQGVLFKIIGCLLVEVFMIAEAGFCLSPSVVFDSNQLQKAFEQTNSSEKLSMTIYWKETSAFPLGVKDLIIRGLKYKGHAINILEIFDEDVLLREKPSVAILNPDAAKELGPMLRTLNPHIKIVITSGYLLSSGEIASMGGDYYLPKPYSVDEFIELIKNIRLDVLFDFSPNNSQFKLPEWSEYAVESIDNHSELKEQLRDRALEYQRRLVRRKSDGALFFLKTRFQPDLLQQVDFIWPRKNDPIREYAAFNVGRSIDANVCDIVLPEPAQAKALASYIGALPKDIYLVRVSGDYKLSDQEVRQKEYKKAFTRNLVLSILIRKYDFHNANYYPIADAQVPMMFDNDQSFHNDLIDMNTFTVGFMENFFASFRYGYINAARLLDQISVKELIAAVNFCENEFNIDRVLETMSDYDTHRHIRAFMYLEYAEQRAKTLRADILVFFRKIMDFKQAFYQDSTEYRQLFLEIEAIEQALSLDSHAFKRKGNMLLSAESGVWESI